MSFTFRIILTISCILTFLYTLRKIRKSQMKIDDSLYWIIISSDLVIISLFPSLSDFFANLFGIGATVNFIFLIMIFLLLIKVFSLSIKLSQTEERLKKLVQYLAIEKEKNN